MELKLFVQARKDGYKILYPSVTPPEFFKFADDIRPESSNPNILGKEFYNITLSNDGCIFTKTVIVQDTQRQGLGNVSFSIFVPRGYKLPGRDVATLLNKLTETYCNLYCPDFYLRKSNEDWHIFTELMTAFHLVKTHDATAGINTSGGGKSAVIYFAGQEELRKYLDAPYQDVYAEFKQMFFVDKQLKDTAANPILALTHLQPIDISGKIDLDNPQYLLSGVATAATTGLGIEVWANNCKCDNGAYIRRKDTVRIRYFKNSYFTPIDLTGKIYDSSLARYFVVHENSISVRTDVQLMPMKKDIIVQVTDEHGSPVPEASVVCLCKSAGAQKKTAVNGIVGFSGSELGLSWTISAAKDNLLSKPFDFVPADFIAAKISLVLLRYKKVTVKVVEQDKPTNVIGNFRVYLNGERQYGDGLEFYGDEITKGCRISVGSMGFETKTFDYRPTTGGNTMCVELQRATKSVSTANKSTYLDDLEPNKPTPNNKKKILIAAICAVVVVAAVVIIVAVVKSNNNNAKKIASEPTAETNTNPPDSTPKANDTVSGDTLSKTTDTITQADSTPKPVVNDVEKKNNPPKEEKESSNSEQIKPAENKDSVFTKFTQEFWALVKEKETKKTQFDELFKKYEMDPKSGHDEHGKTFGNYRTTYNKYLSRNDSLKESEGNYDFDESFPDIPQRSRDDAVKGKDLGILENALKEALEIK